MSKKIFFNPVSVIAAASVEKPKSARYCNPQWYKDTPAFGTKPMSFDMNTGAVNHTIKMCLPFSDALDLGYIQETWQDIMILSETNGSDINLNFTFPTQPEIISISQKRGTYPIPDEFYQFDMFWHPVWVPEVPKGYSVLLTHPLNRLDLPFFTLSGVIDSDKYTENTQNAKLPVFLKKGFSGLIPKGTPMYQVIPFKRDNWASSQNDFDEIRNLKKSMLVHQKFWGGYKKNFWSKKEFK